MTVETSDTSTSEHPRLLLNTLGITSVHLNGKQLELPPRGIALIALLVFAEQKRLAKAQVTRLIWGRESERSALHSLSQLVHTLRRFSPELVLVRGNEIQLSISTANDFELVIAKLEVPKVGVALDMVNGSFLEDLPAYTSAFEDWRSEKQRFLVDRLLLRVNSELGLLWMKGAANDCRSLIDKVSVRLRSYWDESDTAAQWTSILQSTNEDHDQPRRDLYFVGRDSELLTLFQEYEQLRHGVGGTIAILGGTGIGKTTLASTFLTGVKRAGGLTVTISSYEADQASGHRILQQLMASRPFRERFTPPNHDAGETGKTVLLTSRAQEQREKTHFLYNGIAKILADISTDARLVLFIDDLQWMDESSIDFIKFLSRLTDNTAFLLLIALRDEHPKCTSFIDSIRSNAGTVLRLNSLKKTELVYFARQHSTKRYGTSVAKALWHRTNGHPYLVGEVLRCLPKKEQWTPRSVQSTFPTSISAYLRGHTQKLDPSSQLLLMAVATLGKPVPHALLRRICGLTLPQFSLALNPLFEHELLCDDNGVLRCTHDLVREMVYGSLNVSQKRSMHRRIACVLENRTAQPSDILYHYRLGRCRRRTYIGALREAKRNLLMGAGPEADYNYRLAASVCLSSQKRQVILWRRSQAAAATGLLRIARKLLAQIRLEKSEIYKRHRSRIELLALEIDRELSISPPKYIPKHAEMVRNLAVERGDVETEVNALILAARGHLLDAADEKQVDAIIREINDRAHRFPGHLVTATGRAWAAGALVFMGRAADASRLLDLLGAQEEFHQNPQFLSTYQSSRALYYAFSGELRKSIGLFRSAATLAEEARMWRHRKNILGNLSGVLIDTSDYHDAGITLAQLVQTAQVDEAIPHLSLAYINYGLLSFANHDPVATRLHAAKGLRLACKLQRPWAIAYATALMGLVALEAGRISEARQHRDKLLQLDGSFLGNDVVPIEKLLIRVAEMEGKNEWAKRRLISAISNSRLSAVCQTALKIELARLLRRYEPIEAAQMAGEAKEKCRIMGAIRLYDAADALTV